MRPGMFYPWALLLFQEGGDVSIATALSNLITACWVLGAIFVVVLVVVTWSAVRNVGRSLHGRGG